MNPKKMVVLIALLPLVMLSVPHSASADIAGRHLRFTYMKAFKYQGYGPLDVIAQVTDEYGTLVSDATVVIGYGMPSNRDIMLRSSGKGVYVGCDVTSFTSPASGLVVLATASRKGMQDASAKAQTGSGDLCSPLGANVENVAGIANAEGATSAGGADGAAPRLVAQKINAAKLDGKGPLDVSLVVTDQSGKPVTGAKVLVRATDFRNHVDATLVDRGNGIYSACALGAFDTEGAGAIKVHVNVQRPGYQSTDADAGNVVGSLCTNVFPAPAPNAGAEDAAAVLPAARTQAPALAPAMAPAPETYYYNFEASLKPWASGTDTLEPTALTQGKGEDGCTDSGHNYALLQSFKAGGSRPGQVLDPAIPQPIGTWMQARLTAPKAQLKGPVAVHFDFAALNQSKTCDGCILAVYAGNQPATSAGQFRQAGILSKEGWKIFHASVTLANDNRADATYVAVGWFGYDASIGLDCVNITLKQAPPNAK
jgi:hypothetical protein